ncbi:hypothetical protein [Coleofasciculus sp. G2-EDA-02]|uniref:hypothetical protein n=1 Tax=Coleofasciculus sp. G2-EDA-02 TaxID=3069529 RepID=UPI0033005255
MCGNILVYACGTQRFLSIQPSKEAWKITAIKESERTYYLLPLLKPHLPQPIVRIPDPTQIELKT